MLPEVFELLEADICLYMTEFSPRVPDEGTMRTRVAALRATSISPAREDGWCGRYSSLEDGLSEVEVRVPLPAATSHYATNLYM